MPYSGDKKREYQREWARGNAKAKDTQTARRNIRRQYVNDYKKDRGCLYCGEREPVALDFHHHNKDKEGTVSSMVVKKVAWPRLIAEIEKCVVVCANCHRKLHAGILGVRD